MATGVGTAHHGYILREIAALVDAGYVKPLVDPKRFTFAQVAQAHQHAESGQLVGKISLQRA